MALYHFEVKDWINFCHQDSSRVSRKKLEVKICMEHPNTLLSGANSSLKLEEGYLA